jgi:hypothetical protein
MYVTPAAILFCLPIKVSTLLFIVTAVMWLAECTFRSVDMAKILIYPTLKLLFPFI